MGMLAPGSVSLNRGRFGEAAELQRQTAAAPQDTSTPTEEVINISYLCFFLVQPLITTAAEAKTQTDPLKVKQTDQSEPLNETESSTLRREHSSDARLGRRLVTFPKTAEQQRAHRDVCEEIQQSQTHNRDTQSHRQTHTVETCMY